MSDPVLGRTAMAGITIAAPPAAVAAVVSEIQPGDPTIWRPQSYAEWEQLERTKTFLAAWSEQVADERALRRGYAKVIFGLIAAQVLAVFGLLIAQGLGGITLDVVLLKVVLPSVFGEVFGLGYLVTKYLFSQPLRHSLDSLALGARGPGGLIGAGESAPDGRAKPSAKLSSAPFS